MPLKAITKKLNKLDQRRALLVIGLEEARANLGIPCGCGELHKIKDCDVLQTHWYTPPRGCSDGDYWNMGELQIVCPTTGDRNRVLASGNLEEQFRYTYKRLFKSVTDTYDNYGQGGRGYWNNYFLNKNFEYYGLRDE